MTIKIKEKYTGSDIEQIAEFIEREMDIHNGNYFREYTKEKIEIQRSEIGEYLLKEANQNQVKIDYLEKNKQETRQEISKGTFGKLHPVNQIAFYRFIENEKSRHAKDFRKLRVIYEKFVGDPKHFNTETDKYYFGEKK
jgi:cell division protein YceG involved in septum cleavage